MDLTKTQVQRPYNEWAAALFVLLLAIGMVCSVIDRSYFIYAPGHVLFNTLLAAMVAFFLWTAYHLRTGRTWAKIIVGLYLTLTYGRYFVLFVRNGYNGIEIRSNDFTFALQVLQWALTAVVLVLLSLSLLRSFRHR